jgi:hypothetical protein
MGLGGQGVLAHDGTVILWADGWPMESTMKQASAIEPQGSKVFERAGRGMVGCAATTAPRSDRGVGLVG